MRAVVTLALNAGSISEVGSYDGVEVGLLGLSNHGTTGQRSVTVSGVGLGSSGYSVEVTLGATGCEGTEWVSESSVTCKVGSGLGGSLRAVVTAGGAAGSLTGGVSFDVGVGS
eukprot:255159-Rhodomonas_salina.1